MVVFKMRLLVASAAENPQHGRLSQYVFAVGCSFFFFRLVVSSSFATQQQKATSQLDCLLRIALHLLLVATTLIVPGRGVERLVEVTAPMVVIVPVVAIVAVVVAIVAVVAALPSVPPTIQPARSSQRRH
eukprot:m.92759 g.92759  ORF g.92759 m.92759 type:complete len:130 (+) comp15074_c0_seq2:834-1223(+)